MAAPIVGRAKVTVDGKVIGLGPNASPNDVISVDDVEDANKLARLLEDVFDTVSMLVTRWYPRSIDYEDIVVGSAGALVQLQHNFNGRVRWWVVDWFGAAAPFLRTSVTANNITTPNTLVLESYSAGTVTIRVEESG